MNVHKSVRIPSPLLSNLTSRITRNSLKKLMEIMLDPGYKYHKMVYLQFHFRILKYIIANIASDARSKSSDTYVNFRVNDIDETSEDDNKIKNVPRVAEVILQINKNMSIVAGIINTYERFLNVMGTYNVYNKRINMCMNASTHLESKRSQLEHKFKGEHGGEDHIENVQRVSVDFRLPIELHRKRHGVDHN